MSDTPFTDVLPRLLKTATAARGTGTDGTLGFVVSDALHMWLVSLREGTCTRVTPDVATDVRITGTAQIFDVLFSGVLDVQAALTQQQLTISGDTTVLATFDELLRRSGAQSLLGLRAKR